MAESGERPGSLRAAYANAPRLTRAHASELQQSDSNKAPDGRSLVYLGLCLLLPWIVFCVLWALL